MLDKTGKVCGVFTWLCTCADWLCSIPLQRWISVFALIGGVLYIWSAISAIRRNRLEALLAEKQIAELEDDDS